MRVKVDFSNRIISQGLDLSFKAGMLVMSEQKSNLLNNENVRPRK